MGQWFPGGESHHAAQLQAYPQKYGNEALWDHPDSIRATYCSPGSWHAQNHHTKIFKWPWVECGELINSVSAPFPLPGSAVVPPEPEENYGSTGEGIKRKRQLPCSNNSEEAEDEEEKQMRCSTLHFIK